MTKSNLKTILVYSSRGLEPINGLVAGAGSKSHFVHTQETEQKTARSGGVSYKPSKLMCTYISVCVHTCVHTYMYTYK